MHVPDAPGRSGFRWLRARWPWLVGLAVVQLLVVVPTFGSPHDADGVAAIAELFPDRATIGLRGDAVLAGGGGFHCASQQMPSSRGQA